LCPTAAHAGADAGAGVGDRDYLVLAKQTSFDSEDWRLPEVTLLVGSPPTTTRKLLGTLDALCGMLPLVPG
jgi:hypothetical protein